MPRSPRGPERQTTKHGPDGAEVPLEGGAGLTLYTVERGRPKRVGADGDGLRRRWRAQALATAAGNRRLLVAWARDIMKRHGYRLAAGKGPLAIPRPLVPPAERAALAPTSELWCACRALDELAGAEARLEEIRGAAGRGDADAAAEAALLLADALARACDVYDLDTFKRGHEGSALYGRRVADERKRGAREANAARAKNRAKRYADLRASAAELRRAGGLGEGEIARRLGVHRSTLLRAARAARPRNASGR